MRRYGLIPAAGQGARFGGDRPKQYADIAGKPLLAHTLARLRAALPFDGLFVALDADDAWYSQLVGADDGIIVLPCGGATRGDTVRNALAAMRGRCSDDDWVLVHDAARPCVSADALERLVREVGDDPTGGLLAIPAADTLKRADAGTSALRVRATVDRQNLWQAQTPQMFRYGILVAALSQATASNLTDESQAVEALAAARGMPAPRIVRGSAANLKVTFPEDLALATALLDVPTARGRTT